MIGLSLKLPSFSFSKSPLRPSQPELSAWLHSGAPAVAYGSSLSRHAEDYSSKPKLYRQDYDIGIPLPLIYPHIAFPQPKPSNRSQFYLRNPPLQATTILSTTMPPSAALPALIAGVGPGTGAAIARKFAQSYPVILLARNAASYEPIVKEINDNGGKARGISVDCTDEKGMKAVFGELGKVDGKEGISGQRAVKEKEAEERSMLIDPCAEQAAVFNLAGGWIRKPFLDLSLEEFESGYRGNSRGAYLFAHHTLPFLLSTASTASAHPPTLIFTGATASIKGSATFASFAVGKFGVRALSQSLGREFGPKGVHVAHAIIDGPIDTPTVRRFMQPDKPDALISPEATKRKPVNEMAREISKTLNFNAFDEYLNTQQGRLPVLPRIEQVTARVIRVLGGNPGKITLQGTNTYLLGTGDERILVDTGQGLPAWAQSIAEVIATEGITISHVLLTHWHGDHTGGVPDLISLAPYLANRIYKHTPDRGQRPIADGQIFSVEGATVKAVFSPGHSVDHMCFTLEEENAMFTGDNVLGQGTTAIEDLGVYMASLQKMQAVGCTLGYPGHGSTIANLKAKLAEYVGQRVRRERQVLMALKKQQERHKLAGSPGRASVTSRELVGLVHGHGLDEIMSAKVLEPFTDEVLRKLAGDGKVGFELKVRRKKWFIHERA
ncbi:MAG: hypothetical protein Q9187_004489 [Circinaria calcarea]